MPSAHLQTRPVANARLFGWLPEDCSTRSAPGGTSVRAASAPALVPPAPVTPAEAEAGGPTSSVSPAKPGSRTALDSIAVLDSGLRRNDSGGWGGAAWFCRHPGESRGPERRWSETRTTANGSDWSSPSIDLRNQRRVVRVDRGEGLGNVSRS